MFVRTKLTHPELLLPTYSMPGTAQGAADTGVNKTIPVFQEFNSNGRSLKMSKVKITSDHCQIENTV